MKRFLIFLVIAIAVTSLGLSIYYFSKDNEVIFINNTQLSVNAGETFKTDSLLTFQNASKYTKVDYDGVQDESVLKYNKTEGFYAAVKGGATKIVITTSNRSYNNFVINVIVRDGSEEYPYIIDSEEELRSISGSEVAPASEEGNKFTTATHYELGKSITLTQKWTPIENFSGSINGAGFSIVGMDISPYTAEEIEATKADDAGTKVPTETTTAYEAYNTKINALESAGFVSKLATTPTGAVGKITNLTFRNVRIAGNYTYVGAVAGINEGEIRNCHVSTDSYTKLTFSVDGKVESQQEIYNHIGSDKASAIVGSVAGINTTSSQVIEGETKAFAAVLDRVSSSAKIAVSASQEVGGIVGYNKGSQITESYFDGYAIGKAAGLNFAGIAYKNDGAVPSTIIDNLAIVNTAVFDNVGFTCNTIGKVAGVIYKNTAMGADPDAAEEHHIFGNYYAALRTYAAGGTYSETLINAFEDGDVAFAKHSRMLDKDDLKEKSNYITYTQVLEGSNEDYIRTWDFANVWIMGDKNPRLNKQSNSGSVYLLIDYSKVKGSNDFSQTNGAELYETLKDNPNGSFNIVSNIDFAGAVWNPIDLYSGSLSGVKADGSNVVLSNIVIEVVEGRSQGLFIKLAKTAVINNITFSGITIRAAASNTAAISDYVGVLAGVCDGANVNNVIVRNVRVENLSLVGFGGLIGYNDYVANHAVKNVTVDGVTFVNSYAIYAGGITAVNNAILSGTEPKGTLPATYITASNICVNATYTGGIAGRNDRTIMYAKADLNVVYTKDNTSVYGVKTNIYVGGITGYNANTALIMNTTSGISAVVDTKDGYGIYMAGTAAYNSGTIYYATAVNTQITANYSYKVYAGGIAGLTNGVVYGSYVDSTVSITASTTTIKKNNESYVGGIAGSLGAKTSQNIVGSISCSISKAERLQGFFVGGLVGYSCGSVRETYVEGTYIKGFYAGGLAGVINAVNSKDSVLDSYDAPYKSGQFKYVYAVVSIENVNSAIDMSTLTTSEVYNSVATCEKGASAGVAVLVIYGAEVDNCYVHVTFVGEGVKASTTISRECGNEEKERIPACSGVIKNTIFTNKGVSIGKEGGKFVEEDKLRPADGIRYTIFTNNGFNQSVWTAEIGSLPTILGLYEMVAAESDVI